MHAQKQFGCKMQILFSAQNQVSWEHVINVLPYETENRMYALMCDISSWAALSKTTPFRSLSIPQPRPILFDFFQLSLHNFTNSVYSRIQ